MASGQGSQDLRVAFSGIQVRNDLLPRATHDNYVDDLFRHLVGALHVGVPDFEDKYLGDSSHVRIISDITTKEIQRLHSSSNGTVWPDWPNDDSGDYALAIQKWLLSFTDALSKISQLGNPEYKLVPEQVEQPSGSIARHMAVCAVNTRNASKGACQMEDVIFPVVISSEQSPRCPWMQWYRLAELARNIFNRQIGRRFIVGLAFRKHFVRVWAFDRLGALAGNEIDIKKEPGQFVHIMLSLFSMECRKIGVSSFFGVDNDTRSVSFSIHGLNGAENLCLTKRIAGALPIAGRGTTYWEARSNIHPNPSLFVKISWQPLCDRAEGEVIALATRSQVRFVARIYAYGEITFEGKRDTILSTIRGDLHINHAEINKPGFPDSVAGAQDRIPRYLVTRDRGKPIQNASRPSSLIAAFAFCVEGHEGLCKIGILHRNISLHSMLINEDPSNPSWPAYLVELDSAHCYNMGGTNRFPGTSPFTAIGVLEGRENASKHDLESFFWVLFWICIHFTRGGGDANYVCSPLTPLSKLFGKDLAVEKWKILENFGNIAQSHITDYYKPLIPCLTKWKALLFHQYRPNTRIDDTRLHQEIKKLLSDEENALHNAGN